MSRARTVLVGLSATAVLIVGTGALAEAGSSWPRTVARTAVAITPPTGGDVLWNKRYNGARSQDDGATAMAASADGRTVFVTGGGTGTVGGFSYKTLAYNASTGALRWASTYDGPSHGFDESTAIALSPD